MGKNSLICNCLDVPVRSHPLHISLCFDACEFFIENRLSNMDVWYRRHERNTVDTVTMTLIQVISLDEYRYPSLSGRYKEFAIGLIKVSFFELIKGHRCLRFSQGEKSN